jgi:hypothetical protein
MLTAYPPIGAAVQRVRITYAYLEYRAATEVEVTGTDRGLETMEWALEHHWTELAQAGGRDDPPRLVLTNADGEQLELEDDALLQVEWLKEFCVGLEIVSIEPAKVVPA